MISEQVAARVLEAALSRGGGFAEIFAENTTTTAMNMVNGVLERSNSGIVYGIGIRVFDGYNAVYAFSNDTREEALVRLAKAVAGAVKQGSSGLCAEFVQGGAAMQQRRHQASKHPGGTRGEVPGLLRRAHEASKAVRSTISQTNNSYADVQQDILVANSEGLWVEDRRVRTRVVVSAVASAGSEKQVGSFAPGASRGFEFLEGLDMERLGGESAEIALRMLHADYAPSGEMPVVIENGFGGVIFHEACGHGLEATAVAKGASSFAGKLGQMIASPIVTAVDDATLPNEWGSLNIDDEGSPARRNVLIENGILKSYLVDRLNGMKMGMPSTGSSRRESYKFAPTSRMNNTFIEAGQSKPADIISATQYGLYAKKMGGGQVQPATGEFNFAVVEGYMIRGGKIAEPVRGATLIGKGHEVLLDIDMVGDNLAMEQGMCGSISGNVPTNVGQPTIRVARLTVGGRL